MRNAIMRLREKIVNTNDVAERKKLQKRNFNVVGVYFMRLSKLQLFRADQFTLNG